MRKERFLKIISVITIISFMLMPQYGFALPQGEQGGLRGCLI